jgi:alkylation response protein AidB-like acyl-CoA dehydrogenase
VSDLVAAAAAAGEDVTAALQLAREYGSRLPLPGRGQTARRWQVLARLGTVNLTAARVFEAHTDALAILDEAGQPDRTSTGRPSTYGVFAAEAPGQRVDALERDGRFWLSGTKPWCSLGSMVDVGLVTARVGDQRRLFRIDLLEPSVTAAPTVGWVARGLRTVTSTALSFDATPARPVGALNWYLARPGFAWGGIGVAACWYGGARGLEQRLAQSNGRPLDDIAALHVGAVDAALHGAATALSCAARQIDSAQPEDADAGDVLARRTRAVVVEAVEQTLRHVAHALGPAPLAYEPDHAARVADLELYLRQDHAERDLAALGRAVIGLDRS